MFCCRMGFGRSLCSVTALTPSFLSKNSTKWQLAIELQKIKIARFSPMVRSSPNSGSDLSIDMQWMNSCVKFSKCMCDRFSIKVCILSPKTDRIKAFTRLLCVAPQRVMKLSGLYRKYSHRYWIFFSLPASKSVSISSTTK